MEKGNSMYAGQNIGFEERIHRQATELWRFAVLPLRIYTVHAKAAGFAERQKKSPVVKMARVIQVS
jgi:hypothetical protein